MTWPLPPPKTRPPSSGWRLAMKFGDGRVYNFDSVGGLDLGTFDAGGVPRQRNIRATLPGVQAVVFFRPDVVADGELPLAPPRDEFVLFIDEPDGAEPTVILYRDGKVLASRAISELCRNWRWESWARPRKAD